MSTDYSIIQNMADKQIYKVRFYETATGISDIFQFYENLNYKDRAKVLGQLIYLQENGSNVPRPYADTLRDGIHELRIKLSGDQIRLFYFFCFRNNIILTHSIVKHSDRVPENEIDKAIKIREDFLKRYPTIEKLERTTLKGI